MTFFALLTKELRLRLRRERTMWVIITYILLMGLLGWFYLSNNSNYSNTVNSGLSSVGTSLYTILSLVQLILLVLITPSFTATAVNGEKERQTYDLLLCSRLSAFSLVTGKLAAGLMNALLLICASIPLFSLVFFFGGISPVQVLNAMVVFVATTFLLGSIGIFCSTVFKRPSISTAIAYLVSLLWMFLPLIISIVLFSSSGGMRFLQVYPAQARILFAGNPLVALTNTYPSDITTSPLTFLYLFGSGYGPGYGLGASSANTSALTIGHWHISPWLGFTLISLLITLLLILLCLWTIKPRMLYFAANNQKSAQEKSDDVAA
jgi:ABC-type transport system involved in multi-copper enzyme maturation permease subunit